MFWLYLFAIAAGILNTVQSGTNATLNSKLDQPVLSALVVYLGGMLGVLLASPFLGLSFSKVMEGASEVPWWGWIGGLLASLYVLATLLIAQKMGAATFTAVTLTAAVVASLIMDHWGLVGFELRQVTPLRMVGGLLMIIGVIMVARF